MFEDSLYIGEDVDANAAATGKRIPQEGEGTRLTIAAGNTMVFEADDSYVRIARGSQIFAEGTADAPIIFTADDDDIILDIATESDRGLWGGLQINGNGRTNKCHDGTPTGSKFGSLGAASDFDATSNNVHNCHVTAEGRPATYGGNNPSSKGDSEGPLYREGTFFEMYNSIITSNADGMASNECLELHETEGPQTVDAVMNGTSKASSNLIACTEPVKTNRDGFDVRAWLAGTVGQNNNNANNHVIDNLPMVMLLDGGVGSRGYRTLNSIQDSTGGAVTAPLFDASSLGSIFRNPTYLGGASTADDWLDGWAVGLDTPLVP